MQVTPPTQEGFIIHEEFDGIAFKQSAAFSDKSVPFCENQCLLKGAGKQNQRLLPAPIGAGFLPVPIGAGLKI